MTFPPQNQDLEGAVKLFLKAIGHFRESETEKTPERVAEFWLQHLLVGTETERTLQVEGMPAESRDPVIMRDIDLHIVCPHHLTIGMGRGTLAYIPDAEWFGLGTLAKYSRPRQPNAHSRKQRLGKPLILHSSYSLQEPPT